MVAARSAVFTFSPNSINRTGYRITRTTVFIALAIPTLSQLSLKSTPRKNHLRPKILKTLIRPYQPITPPVLHESSTLPSSPISYPDTPQEVLELLPGDTHNSSVGEGDKFEEFQVSESLGNVGASEGFASQFSVRSVMKYDGILVGVFVLQTFFSVLFFWDPDSEKKAGNLGRQKSGGKILLNGNGKALRVNNLKSNENNIVYVSDFSEIEKKIEEIKVMAREARMIEENKKEEDTGDSETHGVGTESSHKIGIQKEINARLEKLEKKMNSAKDRLARPNVNHMPNSVTDKDVKNENGSLMFETKFKLRGPSTKATKINKGFQGIRKQKASFSDKSPLDKDRVHRGVDEVEENHYEAPLKSGNPLHEESKALENNRKRSNLILEGRAKETKENHIERQSLKVAQSREYRMTGGHSSRSVKERNQEDMATSRGDFRLSMNSIPQHGHEMGRNMLSEDKATTKKPNVQTDFWWSSLPYLLAILIQSGSGEESGLFTVQDTTNHEQDEINRSYIVAFEDRMDADHLCFLLEAAFEDLGDFRADVIPLEIQELLDVIKLDSMKVVVVKKKQIQLYAGQPLAEVENALCSLIRGQSTSN